MVIFYLCKLPVDRNIPRLTSGISGSSTAGSTSISGWVSRSELLLACTMATESSPATGIRGRAARSASVSEGTSVVATAEVLVAMAEELVSTSPAVGVGVPSAVVAESTEVSVDENWGKASACSPTPSRELMTMTLKKVFMVAVVAVVEVGFVMGSED
jgi:hypothetical protein